MLQLTTLTSWLFKEDRHLLHTSKVNASQRCTCGTVQCGGTTEPEIWGGSWIPCIGKCTAVKVNTNQPKEMKPLCLADRLPVSKCHRRL